MRRSINISIAVAGFVGLTLPIVASAATAAELSAQIAALMQQVSTLQATLPPSTNTNGQSPSTARSASNTGTMSTPVPAASSIVPADRNLHASSLALYCPTFSKNQSRGSSGTEVLFLQRYLVGQGLLSADALTSTFDARTERALQEWQAKYNIVSSGTPKTTGWGSLGSKTIRLIKLNCDLQANAAAQNPGPKPAVAPSQCPAASRPIFECGGAWQAISDASGCTINWRCALPNASSTVFINSRPAPSSALASTSSSPTPQSAISQCPINPRPSGACASGWRALNDANGCTSAWQCI